MHLLGVELTPDVTDQIMEDPWQGVPPTQYFFPEYSFRTELRQKNFCARATLIFSLTSFLVTFFESDIAGLRPKVKHMNFVHNANAKIALLNSRDRERSFLEKRRLLLVAAAEYQR
jgi:hypothetical protein